jgi:hypothetical protein
MIAMHEFVVPKSIPKIFAIFCSSPPAVRQGFIFFYYDTSDMYTSRTMPGFQKNDYCKPFKSNGLQEH